MGVCAHPLLCVLCQVSECHPGMAGLLCARALLAHLWAFFGFHGCANVLVVVCGSYSLCVLAGPVCAGGSPPGNCL